MDLRTISSGLSVSPQITPDEIAEIKAAGFRSIISNRPDGEGADQPAFDEIESAAREARRQGRKCAGPDRTGPVE